MAIILKTISDSKSAQEDLAKLRSSVDGIKTSVEKTSNSIGSFSKIFGSVIALGAAAKSFTSISDSLTNMQSRLKIATNSNKEFNYALKETADIAIKTRSSLTSVVSLYSKVSLNAAALGKGQKEIAKFTELVSKATTASGASTQEAASGIAQLGQALASNNFAGDELRSILENVPFLAKKIADGLHVSVGELRAMGAAGKLTASTVFGSIINQQKEIDDAFKKVGVTYGAAFTNIGTSFTLMFAALSNSFSSSGGGLADSINNIAIRLKFVASNFDYILLKIKTNFINFILDISIGFRAIWPILVATAHHIVEVVQAMYLKWKPTLYNMLLDIRVWVSAAALLIKGLYNTFITYFNGTSLGKSIIVGFNKALGSITTLGKMVTDKFKTLFPTIDVAKFFPNMKQVEGFVMAFVTKIERGFFWLYDQVIGHSWIPDLVEGVILWTKKLLGSPLKFVLDFVGKSNKAFSTIAFGSAASLIGLINFKKHMFGILATVTTLAAIWAGLKFGSPSIKITGKSSADKIALKSQTFLQQQTKSVKTLVEQFKTTFDKSTWGHLTKQILGMHDSVPGQVNGVNVDTQKDARVPFGPLRLQDNRMFGHDILNALPKDWQVPVLAGVATVFGAAIMLAFKEGTTRTVLMTVLTTAFGIAAAKMIDTKTLNTAFYGAAGVAMKVINEGLSNVFGGNVIKDPFGFLAVIAKVSLLFKLGREFFGKIALNTLMAPTKLARTGLDIIDRNAARKKSEEFDKVVKSYPSAVKQALTENRAAYRDAIMRITSQVDANGNKITTRQAVGAIKSGNINTFGTQQSSAELQAGIKARTDVLNANSNAAKLEQTVIEMNHKSDELKKQAKTLTDRISDAKQAAKDNFKSTGAGLGGIVGGVAGFQLGTEIAKSMTGSPEWMKVGTIMATSFLAQGIGASIGLVITSAILGIGGALTSMVALAFAAAPVTVIAVAIAAALYLGYKLFENLPEKWKTAILDWFNPFQKDKGVKPVANALSNVVPGANFALQMGDFLRGDSAAAQLIRRDRNKDGGLKGLDTVGANAKYIGEVISDRLSGSAMAGEYKGLKLAQINSSTSPYKTSVNSFGQNKAVGATSIDTSKYSNPENGLYSIGTNLTPVKSFGATVKQDTSGLAAFIEMFKNAMKSMGISDTVTPKTEVSPVTGLNTPLATAPKVAKTLLESMQSAKEMSTSIAMLTDSLNKSGYASVKKEDLSNASIDTVNQIADLASRIQETQDKVNAVGANSYEGGLGVSSINEMKAQLNEFIKVSIDENNLPASAGSVLPSASALKGQQVLTLLTQFDTITKTLPDLGLSMEEFRKMSDDLRESIYNTAEDINKADTRLTNMPIGTAMKQSKTIGGKLEIGSTTDVKASDAFKEIDDKRKIATKEISNQLSSVRDSYKMMSGDLTKLNSQISEDIYNSLTSAQVDTLKALNEGALKALEVTKLPASLTSPVLLQEAEASLSKYKEAVGNLIADAATNVFTGVNALKLDLGAAGISFDKSMYNRMSDNEAKILEDRVKVLKDSGKLARDSISEVERKAAQAQFDEVSKAITKSLESKAFDFKSKMVLAGESFASAVSSSVFDGISNVFKGKTSLKDYILNVMDTFSNGIIDSFMKGLLDPFTGENGILTNMLKSIGERVFSEASKMSSDTVSLFGNSDTTSISTAGMGQDVLGYEADGTAIVEAVNISSEKAIQAQSGFFGTLGGLFTKGLEGLGGILRSAWDGLKSLFSGGGGGGGGMFGSLLSGLGGMFDGLGTSIGTSIGSSFGMEGAAGWLSGLFMAEGGHVTGPGTGTSDSIPIWGSNGEFMVNAKATSKHRGLLEAINSGQMPKFANGGVVGASMQASYVAVDKAVTTRDTKKKSTSSTFNINVTGDISRQTRNEIQQMIPQIAVGVNGVNRENGRG